MTNSAASTVFRTLRTLVVLVGLGMVTLYAVGADGLDIAAAADAVGAVELGDAQVEFRVEDVEYGEGFEARAAYRVVDGALVDATPEHDELWHTVQSILPAEYAARVRQLGLFDEGPANTVAMVHQSGVDVDSWILSIDLLDAADQRLLRETLLHELAHLVTLRPGEFTFVPRVVDCDGFSLDIGCAHPGSVMAAWIAAFWAESTDAATFDPAAFVAPYATTAPHEDLAETFLHWAQDRPTDPDTTLAAKYAFFDQTPELVALRDALRNNQSV